MTQADPMRLPGAPRKPTYETIVRRGTIRWGLRIRLPNGETVFQELGRTLPKSPQSLILRRS
jgi:hypothetical protein